MHKVDIQEILTYGYCPYLYKYLYVDCISEKRLNLNEDYNEAFKKTIYGFLSASSGTNPGFSTIKSIWGRIWIKDKKTIDYIYSNPKSWRDTHNEKRKTGISSLKKFYDYYESNPFFPVLYNKKYSINVDGINVIGKFDIIADYNGKISLFMFKNSSRKYNSINISKDLEVICMSYAFNKLFDMKEDYISIFNSEKGNCKNISITDNEYKEFSNSIHNIYKCIKNNIFYKCPNNKCDNCSCKNICIKS